MTRRTGAARVRDIEAKMPRTAVVVAGAGDAPPDVLTELDRLLAHGRDLVRSKARA